METAHANYVSGYIKSVVYDEKYPDVWIPYETTGGSATTYFADYATLVYSYTSRAVRLGGYWYNGTYDGPSYLTASYAASSGPALYGGDLCFAQ